jgi:hypothetical protein
LVPHGASAVRRPEYGDPRDALRRGFLSNTDFADRRAQPELVAAMPKSHVPTIAGGSPTRRLGFSELSAARSRSTLGEDFNEFLSADSGGG